MVSPEDLQERLRPAVKDYAETLQKKAEEQEIQFREKWVCSTEKGGTELTEITVPSRGVKHLIDSDNVTHFDDCAEWLEDSEDEVNLTHSNTKSTYEHWLRNFASKTFNYVGDYEFDEEAYRAAFADKAEPYFENALTLDILIPIPGLADNSEPVTFTPQSPEYPDEQYLCTVTSDFSINEITASEMAAMQNKSIEGHYGEPTKLGWGGKLRFTVEINDRSRDPLVSEDLVEQAGETSVDIVRKVVDGLRLSEPQEDNIWFGPIFILRDNWVTYRMGGEGVERAYLHPDCDIEYRND